MNKKIEQLGLATSLITQSKAHWNKPPIMIFNSLIIPAIEHGNIHFAFAGNGNPIAYWIWANLAPDAEARISKHPNETLHISEWNEGESLWFLDFCAPSGYIRDIIFFIRTEMFHEVNKACSLKYGKDGGIKRVSIWKRSMQSDIRYDSASRCLPATSFASTMTEHQLNVTKHQY